MPNLTLHTQIAADHSRCFDLARDLDLHKQTLAHTHEQAIAGRTSGLIELGEEVTWRGKHLGLYHTHTAKITQYDRPRHFRDEMIHGRFKTFIHDHHFEPYENGTRMTDILVFTSPFGLLGTLVDALVLKRYLRNLLLVRATLICQVAESSQNMTK